MNPLRSLIDTFLHPQKQHATAHGYAFDLSMLPVDLDLPSRPYADGELSHVVTWHVTDVRGGFGVAAYQIAALKKAGIPGALDVQRPAACSDESWLWICTLLLRYHRAAYHGLASRRVGVVRNHLRTLRTSHGNGGNRGIGLAVDCDDAETALPDALVDAGIAMGVERGVEVHKATGETTVHVGHRAWADDRRNDPGAVVWRQIVKPVVESLGPAVAVIGYNTRAGTGLPIPKSWDPSALYDDRGRRVA
jgi:hypothetical protein